MVRNPFYISLPHPPMKVLVGVVLAVVLLAACSDDSDSSGSLEAMVAQCLSDNGVAMYGADSCPACLQQKTVFGTAFSHIDYVECDKSAACQQKSIQSIPTWINAEGDRLVGVRGLGELAEFGGCAQILESGN